MTIESLANAELAVMELLWDGGSPDRSADPGRVVSGRRPLRERHGATFAPASRDQEIR